MVSVRRIALALVTPLVATLVVTAPAAAQTTYTWTNTADNAWLTSGNWDATPFPGITSTSGTNNDTAVFAANLPSLNAVSIGNSFLQLGAITFSNTSSSLSVSSSPSGTVRLNGATVNSQADTVLSNSGNQTLTIQSSSSLELNAALTANYFVANSGATINVMSTIAPKTGTVQSVRVQGGGTVIFSGANTYNDGTLVSSGTLQVANSGNSGTGSGGVTVSTPGRLSGTGSIINTSSANVDIGGSLQPGTDT